MRAASETPGQSANLAVRAQDAVHDRLSAIVMVTTSTGDAQAALEAIIAASNDTEALAAAIREAAFLDATPGEARQKLRGAASAPQQALGPCAQALRRPRLTSMLGPCSCQDQTAKDQG